MPARIVCVIYIVCSSLNRCTGAYQTSNAVVVYTLYSVLATTFNDLLIISPEHISVTLLDTVLTQTCKSTQWLRSQTAKTSSKEMASRTTSRASTKSTTSGVSAMTGLFTRAQKTRRMSLRWAWAFCCLPASLSPFSFPLLGYLSCFLCMWLGYSCL